MKNAKKIMLSLCAIVLSLITVVGCANGGGTFVALPYGDTIEEFKHFYDTTEYNKELFYRNDMIIDAPDPFIAYVTDGGEYDGDFMLYSTSTEGMNVVGFDAWRSNDCVSWETVGPILVPEVNGWAYERFWAPELIYDAEANREDYRAMLGDDATGKGVYFLWFSAINQYDALYYWDENHPLYKEDAIVRYFYNNNKYRSNFCIGLAVSTSPAGPFRYYTNSKYRLKDEYLTETELKNGAVKAYSDDVSEWLGYGKPSSSNPKYELNPYYDPNKRELRCDEAFIDHYDLVDVAFEKGILNLGHPNFGTIDVSPFIDPVTQDKYLYFNGMRRVDSLVLGIKLTDKYGDWTQDAKWETLTQLTTPDYRVVGEKNADTVSDLYEANVNEGPVMVYNKDNGKYYLTLSSNGMQHKKYSVIQAIGDTPLGPFKKPLSTEGGYVMTADFHWDWVSGTGHHGFFYVKDEMYIIYHAHRNREKGDGNRGPNVAKVHFVTNSDGEQVLYAVPTFSLQPIFGSSAKYTNIAGEAKVEASNLKKGSSKKYLTDDLLTAYSFIDFVEETEFKKGESEITFTFDDYRPLRSIMVYQSMWVSKGFDSVKRIEMDYLSKTGAKNTAYINNLKFDNHRYKVIYDPKTGVDLNQYTGYDPELNYDFYRGTPAAIAEFDEIKVKEVRIKFNSKNPINVSEIYLLGV